MRIFSLFALAALSLPTVAKETNNFEITPMVGYRFGGDFNTSQDKVHNKIELQEEASYSLLTAWTYDRNRQAEFLISHYSTDFSESADFPISNTALSITYAHLGGNVPISDGPVPFYVSGGLGLAHFSPSDDQLGTETKFSMNVGLASKIDITEHIGFRVEGRIYGTFFNSDSAVFCDANNCSVYVSSEMWFQSEVNAGITFSF